MCIRRMREQGDCLGEGSGKGHSTGPEATCGSGKTTPTVTAPRIDPAHVEYRRPLDAERAGVDALYAEWGYTRRIAAEDMIWVAASASRLIGVCRIAPENGTHVFRGLYITANCRGSGIGRQLSRHALSSAAVPECYCLPEPHLVGFYGDLGFQRAALETVPPFLQARTEQYHAEGYDVVVMRRVAEIGPLA